MLLLLPPPLYDLAFVPSYTHTTFTRSIRTNAGSREVYVSPVLGSDLLGMHLMSLTALARYDARTLSYSRTCRCFERVKITY